MHQEHLPDGAPVELEGQIILRLPNVVAKMLRDALRHGGSNLRERLSLKMENDMRRGMLQFDHFQLPAKLVDLPCIIEAFKTIDKKTVYKTADVSQMLICTEEEEPEEVDPKPQKKKDGLIKVEKKYLWPHGVTPPLKNVRKRRFRRTLKKKQYSDQPEIEKEVRRLFRMDYEAHQISWEVIDEEEDKTKDGTSKDVLMQGSKTNENPNTSRMTVEIFGDTLSDSDVDDGDPTNELDMESRLSLDDGEDESSRLSRMSDSMSFANENDGKDRPGGSGLVTAFSKDMFDLDSQPGGSMGTPEKMEIVQPEPTINPAIVARKNQLYDELRIRKNELGDITRRREIQENELTTTENMALRQRLESVIRKLSDDQNDKERRIDEIQAELETLPLFPQ